MAVVIYRRVLVDAKDSADGETATTLEVIRMGEGFAGLFFHGHDEGTILLGMTRFSGDSQLIEQAVRYKDADDARNHAASDGLQVR